MMGARKAGYRGLGQTQAGLLSSLNAFNPFSSASYSQAFQNIFGLSPDAVAQYITGDSMTQPPPVIQAPGTPAGWQTGQVSPTAPQDLSNQQITNYQQTVSSFVQGQGYDTATDIAAQQSGSTNGTGLTGTFMLVAVAVLVGLVLITKR